SGKPLPGAVTMPGARSGGGYCSLDELREGGFHGVAEDSVGHLVVGGGFGVDDHESGAVFAGDVAQARHRVDGERGADGEEPVAVFSSGDGGVQHVRVETLPEGDRGGFLDAA